jgi:hypothetical protein
MFYTFIFVKTSLRMDHLSELKMWTEQLRKANQRAIEANLLLEEERWKVIKDTVDAKGYCEAVGISKVTLIARRNKGKIPFMTIGARYRYFLPKGGGEHVGEQI